MTSVSQLVIRAPQALAEAVSDWLEGIAEAVTMDLHDDHIKVAGIFIERYDDVLIRQQLAALSPELVHDWQQIPSTDWLLETARHGAGDIGRFSLLDAPSANTALLSNRSLFVESAHAFGDGFHATTRGCLLALDDLKKKVDVRSYADVGCGTGVLALGARKLWPKARGVLGDIDADAVAVTRHNRSLNGGRAGMRITVGPGMGLRVYKTARPYNLVLANILAGPLCRLAPSVAANLAGGGHAVLSGLLAEQQNMVLAAYRQQRLRLVKSTVINGWVTLVLRKAHGQRAAA